MLAKPVILWGIIESVDVEARRMWVVGRDASIVRLRDVHRLVAEEFKDVAIKGPVKEDLIEVHLPKQLAFNPRLNAIPTAVRKEARLKCLWREYDFTPQGGTRRCGWYLMLQSYSVIRLGT
jgi:hypothetical protein